MGEKNEDVTRESAVRVFGERLCAVRKKKKLQQKDLADLLGIKNSTVCNWERGFSSPDFYTFQRLCRVLDTPADYFTVLPASSPLTPQEEKHLRLYRSLDRYDRDVADRTVKALADSSRSRLCDECRANFVRVAVSDLKACAGTGNYLDSAPAPETVFLRRTKETEAADEVITVTGDSMEPTYRDGDRLLVRHQAAVLPGQIGIFLLNSDGLVKEYRPDGLYPHNRAYDVIDPNDYDDLRCVGLVLGRVTADMLPDPEEAEILYPDGRM